MSTIKIHKSRFGFHPCNYQLFLKLKYLHKQYWIALRQYHRWHRWFLKEPQNKSGDEPKFCSAFVENRIWRKPVSIRGVDGYKWFPQTVVDHDVIEMFRSARIPAVAPVESFSEFQVTAIEQLFEIVRKHFVN